MCHLEHFSSVISFKISAEDTGKWTNISSPLSQGGLSAAPARAVSAVKNINLPEIPRNINIGDLNIKVPNLSQFV